MQTSTRTAQPEDQVSVYDLMRGYYRDDGLEYGAAGPAHGRARAKRGSVPAHQAWRQFTGYR